MNFDLTSYSVFRPQTKPTARWFGTKSLKECCTCLKIDKHAKMPLGFWVSRQPQHSTRYIDKKSKKIKRCGRCVIACQVTDIEGNWQGWQPAGSGNWILLYMRLFGSFKLMRVWDSFENTNMKIHIWRSLWEGKIVKLITFKLYLRSKVTGSAAWSKCKFSCSGFPSILVPQLIAQNHSSIELDAASKGWIGWLFISIRPKADHCLALVTPSLTNVVETDVILFCVKLCELLLWISWSGRRCYWWQNETKAVLMNQYLSKLLHEFKFWHGLVKVFTCIC